MAGSPWEQYSQPESGPWSKYPARASAPEEESFSPMDSAKRVASNPAVMAGPMGLFSAMGAEGMRGLSHVSDKAGSGVAEGLGRIGVPAEVAGAAGVAANMAAGAIPTLGGGLVAKTIASPIMNAEARSLMQSALKPSKELVRTGKADSAIDTMLDYGISVSKGARDDIKNALGGLDDKITSVLQQYGGKTVDKGTVARYVKDAVDKVRLNLDTVANTGDIKQALMNFWNHPAFQGSKDIPVELAHKMKQAFYKELSDKAYGAGVQNTSYDLAQKNLARGLKTEVGKAVPEVEPLLSEQSKLANALKLIENRLPTEGNKNPAGLSLLAENKLAALGFMADRSALIKSLMARGLYSGRNILPQMAGMAAGAAYGGQKE